MKWKWNSYEEVNFEYSAYFDFVNYHEQIKIMKLNVNQNILRAQSTQKKRSGSILHHHHK